MLLRQPHLLPQILAVNDLLYGFICRLLIALNSFSSWLNYRPFTNGYRQQNKSKKISSSGFKAHV